MYSLILSHLRQYNCSQIRLLRRETQLANTPRKKTSAGSAKSNKAKEPDIPKKPAAKTAPKTAAAGKQTGVKAPAKTAAKPSTKNSAPVPEDNFGRRQGASIAFFCLAAFTAAIIILEGESVWNVIHNALFGIFGFTAFIVPLIFVYLGIVSARNKEVKSAAFNLAFSGIFVVFFSSMIHIIKSLPEYLKDTELFVQVHDVWIDPNSKWSGGAIGSFIGGAIAKLFGRSGALITVIILAFAAFMFMTGITIPGIVRFFARMGRKSKDNYTRLAQEREQKRLEREAEEEERRRIEQEETERALAEESRRRAAIPPELLADDSRKETPGEFVSGSDISIKIPTVPGAGGGALVEPAMPVVVDTGAAAVAVPASLTVASAAEKVAETAADAVKVPGKLAKKAKEKKAEKTEKTEKAAPKEEKPAAPDIRKVNKEEYIMPPIDLLERPSSDFSAANLAERQLEGANKLIATLESFKIRAQITNIVRGPSVTRYELVPEAGVRISRITSLADDIAMRLAAKSVRIEAPIPGKSAIGIEVPNEAKSMVTMRELVDTDEFRRASAKSKLSVALGKDITGKLIIADIAKMPHLLVAGTTGSGKSVCLNSMIVSILYNATPDEVKLVMIDPKQVEFTVYNGIGHLEIPVVSNPRKATGALGWAVSEMERRYRVFSEQGVRDIAGFNKLCRSNKDLEKMHRIVIFIDELSDLMMTAPKEVEDSICRLAQMARAAGIHLVIATQRPTVDVITGLIKANIPSRIALYVSQANDSRIIIDRGGAEKLLGNGDMLFSPVGSGSPTRVQGCYIADDEVERIVAHIKSQSEANYSDDIIREIDAKAAATEGKHAADTDGDDTLDPMYNQAAECVIQAGQASTTMLQKKLKLGYARASRVMDQLEETGIVGPAEGAKPRQVLMTSQEWYERQALAESTGKQPHNIQMSFSDIDKKPEPVAQEIPDDDYDDDIEEDEYEEENGFADIIEEDEDSEEETEAVSDEYEEEENGFSDIIEEDEETSEEAEEVEIVFIPDDGAAAEPEEPEDSADESEELPEEVELGVTDPDEPEEVILETGEEAGETDEETPAEAASAVSEDSGDSDDVYYDDDDDYTDPLLNIDDIFADDNASSDDDEF